MKRTYFRLILIATLVFGVLGISSAQEGTLGAVKGEGEGRMFSPNEKVKIKKITLDNISTITTSSDKGQTSFSNEITKLQRMRNNNIEPPMTLWYSIFFRFSWNYDAL